MKDLRGRPEHKATAVTRRKVAIAAAWGTSHEAIALALDICRNTLEKHYQYELTIGAEAKRQEVREAIYRQARKGNVAAARMLEHGVLHATQLPPTDAPGAAPSPIADGLKAARDRAATTAQQGTEWAGVLQRKSLQ